jgi:hypothetical protein
MMDNPLAQKLIRAVEEADSSATLLEAVQQLAAAQLEEAIPTLIAALGYNNPGAAVAAVDGLVLIGEPTVLPLLELLDNHNYTARAWAIRALAGIGDPRGLSILLDAAKTDFALSVRRAAARGLGCIRWHLLAPDQVSTAQAQALEALLLVCQDPEWVVRYAAVMGLQSLAIAALVTQPKLVPKILEQLETLSETDLDLTVQSRIQMAQQQLSKLAESIQLSVEDCEASDDHEAEWQLTLRRLYKRKSDERPIPEGDPRKFRQAAVDVQNPAASEAKASEINNSQSLPVAASECSNGSIQESENTDSVPIKAITGYPMIISTQTLPHSQWQDSDYPYWKQLLGNDCIQQPIIHQSLETNFLELFPSKAAWEMSQQFGPEAAYMFLIFSAYSTHSEKPWEERIQLNGTDLVKLIGWDKRTDLAPGIKLKKIQNLVELTCSLSVLVNNVDTSNQRYQIVTSSIWILEKLEYSGQLSHTCDRNSIDLPVYQVLEPDEFLVQIKPGSWTEKFLSQHKQKGKETLRQYGSLAKSILQINPYRHPLAAKLAIFLSVMSHIHPSGKYTVSDLLEQLESQQLIAEMQDDKTKQYKLMTQWDNALCILRQLGWKVEFDAETYSEAIRPAWSLPYGSSTQPKPRSGQWLSSWLSAKVIIQPTNLIQQQMEMNQKLLEDEESFDYRTGGNGLDIYTPEIIPGYALEKALAAKGLSQAKLAEQLNLDRSMVTRWIKGSRPIQPRHREQIWQLLGHELQVSMEVEG